MRLLCRRINCKNNNVYASYFPDYKTYASYRGESLCYSAVCIFQVTLVRQLQFTRADGGLGCGEFVGTRSAMEQTGPGRAGGL